MRTRAECTAVLGGLLDVYDATPPTAHWRVDLSSLSIIPLMLVGALVAYKANLTHRGQNLIVVVSPECFHSRFFSGELRKQFDVEVLGESPRNAPAIVRRSG